MKNFAKPLDRDGAAFKYLISKFPKLSLEKIKAGVFVELQIRELIVDIHFDNTLEEDEKTVWENFKSLVRNFLGTTELIITRKLLRAWWTHIRHWAAICR